MNIKITHSWLLDYLETDATPVEIQKYLSLCGPSIERIEEINGETVYDIEITSNRIDTASVLGIAREAAAIIPQFKKNAVFKKRDVAVPTLHLATVPISITDPEGICKRVLGVVMEVDSVKNSPDYIARRLQAIDMRSINNLVDVTNYVMTEIGHPTHVFDYDRIATHKLILRHSKKNEEIVTLDEKKYQLDETDVIIDDGTGRVIDLPGIMGTANSVITNDTKRILFFIESNDPVCIRRTSMRYGIRTMASTINEKNPDSELAYIALLRGIELFKEVANAKVVSPIVDIYRKKATTIDIETTKSFIDSKVGVEIPLNTIVSILTNLEFVVKVADKEKLIITVPTHRISDVTIPEDIVEEVARVYGYFAIPTVLQIPAYVTQPKETELLFKYQYAVKSYLKNRGLSEAMNYSATSLELLQAFHIDKVEHLYITNSISEDIKYLRRSLIPSLVKNVKQNEGFVEKIKLFEVAKTYIPKKEGLPDEEFMLSMVVNTSLDDLKKIIFGLFDELNIEMEIIQTNEGCHPFFLDTVEGHIMVGNRLFGSFGQVKTTLCRKMGIQEKSVFAAELSFKDLIQSARVMPDYKSFSQYAHISQDITIKKTSSFTDIKKIAFNSSSFLESLSVKDQYQDTITLRCVFTNKLLNITEEDAKKEIEKIKEAL